MVTTRTYAGQIQLYAATAAAPVRWRLLSGNNREVGRGAGEYRDAETCRLAVKELQSGVGDLEPVVRRATTTTWTWQVVRSDELIALSGRSFDRLIRCEQSLTHFLSRLADAELGETVMVSQARRWRTAGS